MICLCCVSDDNNDRVSCYVGSKPVTPYLLGSEHMRISIAALLFLACIVAFSIHTRHGEAAVPSLCSMLCFDRSLTASPHVGHKISTNNHPSITIPFSNQGNCIDNLKVLHIATATRNQCSNPLICRSNQQQASSSTIGNKQVTKESCTLHFWKFSAVNLHAFTNQACLQESQ